MFMLLRLCETKLLQTFHPPKQNQHGRRRPKLPERNSQLSYQLRINPKQPYPKFQPPKLPLPARKIPLLQTPIYPTPSISGPKHIQSSPRLPAQPRTRNPHWSPSHPPLPLPISRSLLHDNRGSRRNTNNACF